MTNKIGITHNSRQDIGSSFDIGSFLMALLVSGIFPLLGKIYREF